VLLLLELWGGSKMKLPLRSAAIKAQCEELLLIGNLTPLVIPPICDAVPPSDVIGALVQTGGLIALVQTGGTVALVQTGTV